MKAILKTIGVILLSASILTQIAGCASDRARMAEKMLEEKYNKSFEVTKIGKKSDGSLFDVYCKSGDMFFSAKVDNDGEYMYDNYDEALLCKDIKDKMSAIIGEIAEDFEIRINVYGGVDQYTQGTAATVISSTPNLLFDIRIAINDDKEVNAEPAALYDVLSRTFRVESITGAAIVAFVDSESMSDIREELNDNPDIDSTLDNLLEEGTTVMADIQNGQMDLTQSELEAALY